MRMVIARARNVATAQGRAGAVGATLGFEPMRAPNRERRRDYGESSFFLQARRDRREDRRSRTSGGAG
jgi:hypothetical protein